MVGEVIRVWEDGVGGDNDDVGCEGGGGGGGGEETEGDCKGGGGGRGGRDADFFF